MTKHEEPIRVNVIMPPELMAEIEKELLEGVRRNVSEVVRSALFDRYKLDDPVERRERGEDPKPVEVRRFSLKPEDLAEVLNMDEKYTIDQMVQISQLSRTTVKRILEEGEGTIFSIVEGSLKPKLYQLIDVKKEASKKKKRRRGRKKKLSLDDMIKEARKGLKLRQEQEEGEEGLETYYFVELEDGDERLLGTLSDDEFIASSLVQDGTITKDDWTTYRLKYYYEHPDYWNDRIGKEELSDRLKSLDEVVKRVDQHLKNQ